MSQSVPLALARKHSRVIESAVLPRLRAGWKVAEGRKKRPLEAVIQIQFGVDSILLAPHDDDREQMEPRRENMLVLYVRVSRGRK